MFLKYQHSFLDFIDLWVFMVNASKLVTILNVKTCFLFKVSVPVEELGGLIFRDIGLEKFSELAS